MRITGTPEAVANATEHAVRVHGPRTRNVVTAGAHVLIAGYQIALGIGYRYVR